MQRHTAPLRSAACSASGRPVLSTRRRPAARRRRPRRARRRSRSRSRRPLEPPAPARRQPRSRQARSSTSRPTAASAAAPPRSALAAPWLRPSYVATAKLRGYDPHRARARCTHRLGRSSPSAPVAGVGRAIVLERGCVVGRCGAPPAPPRVTPLTRGPCGGWASGVVLWAHPRALRCGSSAGDGWGPS